MSKRLTNKIRTDIVQDVVNEALNARKESLVNREKQLALRIYLQVIDGHVKHIQEVPKGYYFESPSITVYTHHTKKALKDETNASRYKKVAFSMDYKGDSVGPELISCDMRLPYSVRFPHYLHYGEVRLLDTTGPGADVCDLVKDWGLLLDDLTQLYAVTTAALSSVTTIKRLLENYPELASYCPADTVNSLAVPHGKIASLIACTKADDCAKGKTKKRRINKPGVITL